MARIIGPVPACSLQGNLSSWGTFTANQVFNDLKTSGDGAFIQGGMKLESNGKVYVNVRGQYVWHCQLYATLNNSQQRCSIRHNGSVRYLAHIQNSGSGQVSINCSGILDMDAGDYIEMVVDYAGDIYRGAQHSFISGFLVSTANHY